MHMILQKKGCNKSERHLLKRLEIAIINLCMLPAQFVYPI